VIIVFRGLKRAYRIGTVQLQRQSSLCSAAIAALLFAGLTCTVGFGTTKSIDDHVTRAMQAWPASWLDWASSLLAVLGSVEVAAPVALILGVLVWRCEPRLAVLLAGAAVLATVIEFALKYSLTHPGPLHEFRLVRIGLLARAVDPASSAFAGPALPNTYPSGHVVRAVLLAFTASALVSRREITIAAAVFVLAMALSRIYMGSHWASDVVGGVLLGWCCIGASTAWRGNGASADRHT